MYFKVVIEVLGGLALFIFGLNRLSSSLQRITSNKLKSIINILAKKSWSTVLIGIFTTMIIQSSSATSVMSVGFVNAGLITLRQAIGIIMGANIGTTITAQIVSFNIDIIAFPIIIIGFLTHFLAKRRRIKNIGMVIIGLGLIFLGMTTMKGALEPLRDLESFKNFLLIFSRNPFLGLLAGIILTTLLQSSSATIGLMIALASQGLIPMEAAIPILLGDNIGTCSTALIASIGTTLTSKRTAFAHLLFNIFGTGIFLILIYVFKLQSLIINITGSSVPHQIANMHTGFNIITTVLLFPFIGFFKKIVIKLFPGKDKNIPKNALYLDYGLIQTPSIALDQVKRELLRVAGLAKEMLDLSVENIKKNKPITEEKILDMESATDSITEDIVRYLTKLSQKTLTFTLSNRLTNLLHIAYDIERAADHAESIMYLSQIKEENKMIISELANKELVQTHKKLDRMYEVLISAMEDDNTAKYTEVDSIESEIDSTVKTIRVNHLTRLQNGQCMPLSGVIFADIIMHFERIGDLLHGISRSMLKNKQ